MKVRGGYYIVVEQESVEKAHVVKGDGVKQSRKHPFAYENEFDADNEMDTENDLDKEKAPPQLLLPLPPPWVGLIRPVDRGMLHSK